MLIPKSSERTTYQFNSENIFKCLHNVGYLWRIPIKDTVFSYSLTIFIWFSDSWKNEHK